jgi:heptosyltransferase-1
LRLLVVKLSSLGDVVQTLPVLHDIHAQFPRAKIDWVVEEAFAELVRQAPSVERVIPVAQRRWRRSPLSRRTRGERGAAHEDLKRDAYDAVIDFQGLVKSAVVARRARLAPGGFTATYGNRSELCGYEWPVRLLLQRKVAMPLRIHAVARARMLAAKALGYAVPEDAPVYPWTLDTPASPPRVMLAHGTTRAENEWPAADWIALGRVLAQQGFEVLLPQASAAEEDLAGRVAAGIGAGARVLPRMGLPALLAQMRGCSGLIGVDSGVAHMGVALDLPVVEIFSQPRAWRAGPVGRPHQRSVGGEGAPSAAEVIAAWNGCWEARPVADLA